VPNGGVRKVGYTGIAGSDMCGEQGVTPQNHRAQEGVSRGKCLIPLAMKPQRECTIWSTSYSVYL
jgi:hypothetical protein